MRDTSRSREAELEQKLQRADAEMARLRRMSATQRGKGGFDDIAHAAFNELNVPMVDRAQQQGVDQIKREVQQQIKQCVLPISSPCPPPSSFNAPSFSPSLHVFFIVQCLIIT